MRLHFGIVMLLIMLSSCDPDVNRNDNNSPSTDIVGSTVNDTVRFETVHARIRAAVEPFAVPGWIHFDSITGLRVPLTAQESAVLFPKDFGIPSEVSVSAFAKHEIDSVTNGIWFYMEVGSGDASPNKDIWLVLYNKTSGPTAAHCFATSGVGYAYARMHSPVSFREVSIDEMENINVTTGTVTIVNGAFVKGEETHKTFASDQTSYNASRKYVNDFLK